MHSAINWKMLYTLVSASHSVHLLRALTLRARLRVCMWTALSWYRISLVCRLYCDWIQRSHVCLLSVLKTFAREVERLSILKRSPVLLLKKRCNATWTDPWSWTSAQRPQTHRLHGCSSQSVSKGDHVYEVFPIHQSHCDPIDQSHCVPTDQSRCPDRPVSLSRQTSHAVPIVQSHCPDRPCSHPVPIDQSRCPDRPITLTDRACGRRERVHYSLQQPDLLKNET